MKISRYHIFLFSVACIGLFLRLYDLGGESLWLDEGISISRAQLPVVEIIKQLLWDNHPPLYFTILHFWIFFAGDSEIAVRALSVLFSFSSLLVMYRIGTVLFSRETGILSTLLLAISVFHLRYAQEARSYSLMVFLTMLSMYFLYKFLESGNGKDAAGYIISSILLLFTHHHGIFVLLGQNIFFLTAYLCFRDVRGIDLKKWSVIQATILILYLPWILPWTAILVHRILDHRSGIEWLSAPTFTALASTISVYAGSKSLTSIYVLLIGIGFLPARSSRYPAVREQVPRTSHAARMYFLLIWLAVPIIAPFVISILLKPMYHVRYTIAALPAFYILAARGIQAIRHKYIKIAVLAVIIAFSLFGIRGYYMQMDKNPWREAIHHIDEKAGRGDLILYVPGAAVKVLHTYYSGRGVPRAVEFPSYWETIDHENVKKLERTVHGFDRVWLVVAFHLDPDNLMVTAMKDMNYRLLNRMIFRGITVFEFSGAGNPVSKKENVR